MPVVPSKGSGGSAPCSMFAPCIGQQCRTLLGTRLRALTRTHRAFSRHTSGRSVTAFQCQDCAICAPAADRRSGNRFGGSEAAKESSTEANSNVSRITKNTIEVGSLWYQQNLHGWCLYGSVPRITKGIHNKYAIIKL